MAPVFQAVGNFYAHAADPSVVAKAVSDLAVALETAAVHARNVADDTALLSIAPTSERFAARIKWAQDMHHQVDGLARLLAPLSENFQQLIRDAAQHPAVPALHRVIRANDEIVSCLHNAAQHLDHSVKTAITKRERLTQDAAAQVEAWRRLAGPWSPDVDGAQLMDARTKGRPVDL